MTSTMLLLLAAIGSQSSMVDLSTPKKAALSFCAAIQSQRWPDAAACVVDGSVLKAKPLTDTFPKVGSLKLTLIDLTSETMALEATVTGKLFYTLAVEGQPRVDRIFEEKLELQRVGSKWLIVARQPVQGATSGTPLAGMAAVFAFGSPRAAAVSQNKPAPAESPAAKTLSNLKQIAVGMMIYAADYDDLLPKGNLAAALGPYVRNDSVFRSPMATTAKPSPYSMNPLLLGKSLAKVAKPESTVLVYEGQNRILAYLYNSKGAVVFADGKAKLVTKSEAAKLNWKP